MDPELRDKIAFFECLDAVCEEKDTLGEDEEAYRQRSKAFRSVTSKPSSAVTQTSQRQISQLGATVTKRKVSDLIPTSSDPDVEIIAVTPLNGNSNGNGNNNPKVAGRSLLAGAPASDSSVVPETEIVPTKQPLRRSTRSSVHPARHSSPPSDPSPLVRMGKRKKEAPLKLVPEKQRIFKDFSFYYIPNDDINPARRLQITKAREHGATWCRELAGATHIIVDKKLTYADIERHLQDDPKFSEKVLVNETYPIDCLRRRIIANPVQGQYKVAGVPALAEQAPQAPLSEGESDTSLKLKPRRKKATRRAYMSASNTQSSSEVSPSQRPRTRSSTANHRQSQVQKETLIEEPEEAIEANDDLTQCIHEMKTTDGALLDDDDITRPSTADEAEVDANADDLSDADASDDERPTKKRATNSNGGSRRKKLDWQEKFICTKGGTKNGDDKNPNAETIKVLQGMLEVHTLARDDFRVRAYRLAISTLRAQPKKICTAEEARALPHIGRIADKIEEIVNTNRLRQLEYAQDDPRRKIVAQFVKIYGVGLSQAQKWIAQGFKTLDDLRDKAELNANQKIGLEHFDDLNTRIPRSEMDVLADCVKKTATAIDHRVELIVGGSYRRGADNSGDIDFIITKKSTSSTKELAPFLDRLVGTLTEEGFLTAELAAHHGGADDIDGGSKWHGCCVLPEHAFPGPKKEHRPIWRRIDLLLVPETEIGAALIYFTGNDIFNRSIRLLARKKGMRLNQRGLYTDVVRGKGNKRLNEGTLLEARDEKKIFAILGVRWREPHERWCG
ncbi:uncharacterized protein F4822DRAFT_70185 [Hypoxylon trugodes]|uniref:uncharacterized protein n=1 Tax=Hypoxylon trugodes TaxID=326681 RepID=UPI0021952E65|nr:uncharacterized protein F4822DRAFT_70185 [Hypoxylon trugodes]KAI1383250.1 hypothetical protein F4822DRAFT_70185 [Hypoxylon trugodes]